MPTSAGAYSASVIAASAMCHECSAEFSRRDASASGVRRRTVFSLSASTMNAIWRARRSLDIALLNLEVARFDRLAVHEYLHLVVADRKFTGVLELERRRPLAFVRHRLRRFADHVAVVRPARGQRR